MIKITNKKETFCSTWPKVQLGTSHAHPYPIILTIVRAAENAAIIRGQFVINESNYSHVVPRKLLVVQLIRLRPRRDRPRIDCAVHQRGKDRPADTSSPVRVGTCDSRHSVAKQ